MRSGCGGALTNFELRRGFARQGNFRLVSRTRDVVRHGDADFENVARRGHGRHARRDDERPAHNRILLGRTGRVGRNGHGHDGERAVEIIGHIVGDFALGPVGIDHARPENDRLFRDALERIQTLLGVAIAARRRTGAEDGKFRHDQIDDLRRFDGRARSCGRNSLTDRAFRNR